MATAVDMPQTAALHPPQGHKMEEMETFFDFNQGEFHSPASTQSPTTKLVPNAAAFDTSVQAQSSEYLEHQSRQYNGPSHEYSRFRQQTGLPTGAFAQMHGNNFGVPQQQMAFASSQHQQQVAMGYNSTIGMDLDFAGEGSSRNPGFLYPNDSMDEFVDASTIDTKHLQPPQSVNRLRPGMHSQQAEAAKAEAIARQQRQQQMMQQQQQRQQLGMPQQLPLPQATAVAVQPVSQDSEANQEITRLLNQMRQGSASTTTESSPELDGNAGIASAASRTRKDEDDMDEDERLLASEEGKKLSSKERRQLRNKVSARAFRSRRKEYISQLEAEVAAKTQENNELRDRNNHLFQQNKQLLQLSQTLIRHPGFSTFMEDLSRNPALLQQMQQQPQQQPQVQTQPQAQHSQPKLPSQNNLNVGMVMLPDQNLDLSMLNLGSQQSQPLPPNSQAFSFMTNPQIFAVHDVPAGPSTEELEAQRSARKMEAPLIPELPRLSQKEDKPATTQQITTKPAFAAAETCDLDNDPEYVLYHSRPAVPVTHLSLSLEDAGRMLEQSLSGKVPVHFEMTVTKRAGDGTIMSQLDQLFAPAHASMHKLQQMI